ncbi:transmembrane protein 39A-A-like [Amphiura filiformis]|uniref:transmembrane protein 39A-A-like n=1 Tax=Amphiura filiformis TaxID=82378 RepID=UPI003B21B1BD
MPGGRRGPGRPQLSRSAPPPPIHATNVMTGAGGSAMQSASIRNRNGPTAVSSGVPVTTLITITPVQHPEIPLLPIDGNLAFEASVVFYLITALFLQYVNIYKTVWWLPLSPSNTAMNFYLIDPYLVVFITLVLTRRLVWSFVKEVYRDATSVTVIYCLIQLFKFALIVMVIVLSVWSIWMLFQHNSPLNLLFLTYPAVSYFLLYGLTIDLNNTVITTITNTLWPKEEILANEKLTPKITTDVQRITRHKCTHIPHEVRCEADVLKYDFNSRMKNVLFNSMVCAYYVGFVPICFLHSSMYLDLWWACLMIGFVWISSFVMFGSHFLPPRYCDTLHRCSLHLGRWQKVEHGYSNTPQHVWSESTVWPQGVLVRYQKGLYKAMGQQNVALPSDGSYARFHFVFHQPMRVLNLLVGLEISVIVVQLYLLIAHSQWNYVISLSLLLFCNYYAFI